MIGGLFSQGRYRLLIDLTDLGYVSSAGVGVFLAAHMESEENGGKVVLLKPQARVTEVLDLMGLIGTLNVAKDHDEAMAALRS